MARGRAGALSQQRFAARDNPLRDLSDRARDAHSSERTSDVVGFCNSVDSVLLLELINGLEMFKTFWLIYCKRVTAIPVHNADRMYESRTVGLAILVIE